MYFNTIAAVRVKLSVCAPKFVSFWFFFVIFLEILAINWLRSGWKTLMKSPYHKEYPAFRRIIKVKPCSAGLVLKSFCLRDRGGLGNEGWPISLKIGTQSRYVDLCNVPKFQLQRRSFSRVLDISLSGVPRGWFSVQFWPLFNLSFSNVQLISDKNKTMFAMPYS